MPDEKPKQPRLPERPWQPVKRRPYRRPVLECYGTLHELTGAVGNMGAVDGGGPGPRHRTQL